MASIALLIQSSYIKKTHICILVIDNMLNTYTISTIRKSTAETAALTGSMQLLAGVKLSTGRPITNHPHYEDKGLRQRTKEVRLYM